MKKRLFQRFAFFIVPGVLLFLNSCNVLNPNIMLYADKHYQFDTLGKDTAIAKESRLGPNDIIEFRLFANDGFKLIDIISTQNGAGATANVMMRQGFEYTLDDKGAARLPIIGEETLSGMSIREAENFLEKRYSEFYVKPFVILKIINKRIIIFTGEPGQAKVLSLSNNNTTVLEALALAGGISADGKAFNIKLIRSTNDPKHPKKVYKIDLSKIETGLVQGATIVQSNDIIYVEPRRQIASKALREITPVLSLTTSLITFFYLITRIP
ncbi:MAG: polysaccharide biosynthesis/export family protein [Bacteroidetes bacterium]|jgi:polysaccharide export outer membrane protein|nr:polysaccharide biosynthesis/export family protein [Bacteroidota bacterium]